MPQFQPDKPQPGISRPFIVMHSFAQYKAWFLDTYDLTFFSDEEIIEFFQEERPDSYPCIPFYGDPRSTYPTHYICVEQIKWWVEEMKISQ